MRAIATVPLHTLPLGARFRLPLSDRTGTLLMVNECRARVRYDTDTVTRTIQTARGTVDLPAVERAIDISPNAEVITR